MNALRSLTKEFGGMRYVNNSREGLSIMRKETMNRSLTLASVLCSLFILSLAVTPTLGQLSDVDAEGNPVGGDNVLNAPYRGPVSAWREANLDMAYGEIKNFTVRYNYYDGDDDDPIARLYGNWDRDVIRIYLGHNASGTEVKPRSSGYDVNGAREGNHPANFKWKLSVKVVGTKFLKPQDFPLYIEYYAGQQDQGSPCSDGCCPGYWVYWPYVGMVCNYPCANTCFCPGGCLNDIGCTRDTGDALNIRVAPTAVTGGVGGTQPWYPGTSVMDIVAGAAHVSASVNESARMIGQSTLYKPSSIYYPYNDDHPVDTYVDVFSYDVRLPGMPETVFIQDKTTFDDLDGTPWAGNMPGYWVEKRPLDDDQNETGYDVVASDGTIFRFSEPRTPTDAVPPAENSDDPEGLWFLKYIIPAGCDESSVATVTYEYDEFGCTDDTDDQDCRKYVTRIFDGDGNDIVLTRDQTTLAVTNVVAFDLTWTIGSDNDGWINRITPPDGKGERQFVHSTDGKLTTVKNDAGENMYSFGYAPSTDTYAGEILTETHGDQTSPCITYCYGASESSQTITPGGNDEVREITCTYKNTEFTSGEPGILHSVEFGDHYDAYTWDENNEWGNVVLLSITRPDVSAIWRYYTDPDGTVQTINSGTPFCVKTTLMDSEGAELSLSDISYRLFNHDGTEFLKMPRLIETRDGKGAATTITYFDADGDSQPDYDLGLVDTITGPVIGNGGAASQSVTRFTYNTSGNSKYLPHRYEVKVSDDGQDASWNTTEYEYDALRRLVQVTVNPDGVGGDGPLVTDYTANDEPLRADGLPTLVKDANGFLTRYIYHRLTGKLRLWRTMQYLVAGDTSASNYYGKAFDYDNEGWLCRIKESARVQGETITSIGDNRKEFEFDRLGRVTRATTSDTSMTTTILAETGFEYNYIGELVRTTAMDGLFSDVLRDNRGFVKEKRFGYGATIGIPNSGTPYGGLTLTYAYDGVGRLENEVRADGLTINHGAERDGFGRSIEVAETPSNASTKYTYDSNSNVIEAESFYGIDSISKVTTEYDEAQRPIKLTNFNVFNEVEGNDQVKLIGYYLNGQVSRTVSRGSSTTSSASNDEPTITAPSEGDYVTDYTYTGTGRIKTITTPSAEKTAGSFVDRVTEYGYDDVNSKITITTGNGTDERSITQKYDALGRLIKTTNNQTGGYSETTYNHQSLPLVEKTVSGDTSPANQVLSQVEYAYDCSGRLRTKKSIDSIGGLADVTLTYQYDPTTGRLHTITRAGDKVTTFEYTDSAMKQEVTDPIGNVVTQKLDVSGRLSEVSVANQVPDNGAPRMQTANWSYTDASSLNVKMTRGGNPEELQVFHNPLGEVIGTIDQKGTYNKYTPDHTGNVTEVIEDINGLKRTTKAKTSPSGAGLSKTFNPTTGNPASDDQETSVTRAANGAVLTTAYPDDPSNPVTTTYNVFGELTQRTDQAGRTVKKDTTYTATGRVVTTKVGNIARYVHTYDELGRMVSAEVKNDAGTATDSLIQFEYDGHGQLKSEIQTYANAGTGYETQRTNYQYDAYGQLISIRYPDVAEETLSGQVILNFDGGSGLDDLGRPTQLTVSEGSATDNLATLAYNGGYVGTLEVFPQDSGSTASSFMKLTRQFDEMGREIDRQWEKLDSGTSTGTFVDWFHYAYDAVDNVIAAYSDQPGASTTLEMDSLNRMVKMVKGNANNDDLTAANGLTPMGKVLEYDRKPASGMGGIDLLGNVIGSLLTVTKPDGEVTETSLTVDDITVGNAINAITRLIDGVTQTAESFVYDKVGNLIADGEKYYRFNIFNQLIAVHEIGTAVVTPDDNFVTFEANLGNLLATFTYDGLGRRLTQTSFDTNGDEVDTLRYLYAGHRVLEIRKADTNDLTKRNFWSPEGLDTILRADELQASGLRSGEVVSFFFTTDRMGSPTAALITENGTPTVVERYVYDIHGQSFTTSPEGCRRADIDCDGLIGAADLVLVRNAYTDVASEAQGARENICGGGTDGLEPDDAIDEKDLVCVRDELGKGVTGLYADSATGDDDPFAGDLPKPTQKLGLHGLPIDESTGLVYARARYYHPTLGRWMARDPKGYVDGGNLYEAFKSNHAKFSDPMGTGVITWVLAGEYGVSDWDFILEGGLQATYVGFVKGQTEAIVHGGIELGKTVSPWHRSNTQQRLVNYVDAEYNVGGASTDDSFKVSLRVIGQGISDFFGGTSGAAAVTGEYHVFAQNGEVYTQKLDWFDRTQFAVGAIGQFSGGVSGLGGGGLTAEVQTAIAQSFLRVADDGLWVVARVLPEGQASRSFLLNSGMAIGRAKYGLRTPAMAQAEAISVLSRPQVIITAPNITRPLAKPYLFRGTTEGYKGNPATIKLEITPTTTDPVVATLFAAEASKHGTPVVLVRHRAWVRTRGGNHFASLEAEVGVELLPAAFAEGSLSFSLSKARAVLRDMGVNIPGRILDKDALRFQLKNTPRLSEKETLQFLENVRKN